MSNSNTDVAAYTTSITGAYCNFAALALLLYETSLTFDREVRHIWQRKVSAATWIFLLNRYLVIMLYAVNIPSTFTVSDSSCPVLVRLSQVLIILTYGAWGIFSCLRTYAMHERAWHIALVVLTLSLVPVWIYIFRDSREDIYNFAAPIFCQIIPRYASALTGHLTIVSRSCLILSDLLVLGVTWSKTYGIMRLSREKDVHTPLSLTTVLLRDGSTYFTVWTVLNALHIAGTYVQSIQYITIFTEAATSILVSRFILNLREVASGPFSDFDPTSDAYQDLLVSWHMISHSSDASARSTGRGVPDFIAPLGATLDQRSSFESDAYDSEYKERDADAIEGAAAAAEGADMELVQTVSLHWRNLETNPFIWTHDNELEPL